MTEIWAIILAAGSSTRMKKQKLLLPYKGKTIVENAVENAVHVTGSNVMVVMGSHKEEIRNQIKHYPVNHCVNKNYLSGMLSSVICGFLSLPKTAKAALIFLGDQPQIPFSVPQLVCETWKKSGKGIVIPIYKGKRGHPALIETRFITDIKRLNPERGLRQLYEKFPKEVLEINCSMPEILRDIDTPEEYEFEINKK